MQITSVNNPIIKEYRRLLDKKGRAEQECFLIEGTRLVGDALSDSGRLQRIIFDAAKRDKLDGILRDATSKGIDLIEANEKVIGALSDTVNAQGVVAVAEYFELPLNTRPCDGDVIVALDGLQDPGNIGTIIRTAEAAGVAGIVISSGSVDRYNPKLVRATMGAIFRLPVVQRNLCEFIAECRDDYTVVAAALGGADFYARSANSRPKLLIIGSEARGISDEVLRLAHVSYELPISGKAESLNAAIAAGIMIYDLKKRG